MKPRRTFPSKEAGRDQGRHRKSGLLLWRGALLLGLLLPVTAQGFQEEPEAELELTFSQVSARRGEEVAVPIYLKAERNLHDPFRIVLVFPVDLLNFRRLEPALLGRRAKWKFRADVKNHPSQKALRRLEIEVDPSEAEFFPSGVVAYARFQVAQDAQEGEIRLESALEDLAPSWRGKQEAALLRVYSQPVYGCFFYMH